MPGIYWTVFLNLSRIIVATSGGDDRADRKINIWDVRADTLLVQLENTTTKPVLCLKFHPGFPELLISADMSGDVNLWNWKEEQCIRSWRKHHTRIIYQLEFVPGDDTRLFYVI